ncbi:hypothetical protein ACIBP6_28290 [Nonomuraea terrae]|uniref:hypothetical protein n=1 Tax=Nonomuraea terrae TaxID=2530383 RepID=UPI00378B2EDF
MSTWGSHRRANRSPSRCCTPECADRRWYGRPWRPVTAPAALHRDLNPGNGLLGPHGPRAIGFGVARALPVTHRIVNGDPGLTGTPEEGRSTT